MKRLISTYRERLKKTSTGFRVVFLCIVIGVLIFFIFSVQASSGPLALNWIGEWNNSSTYSKDDVVQYKGDSYVSQHANKDHAPDLNAGVLWNIVISQVAHLFDIVMHIDEALLTKSSDLIAKTQFTNFGISPTLVNMVYVINDDRGNEVFTEKDVVTVETERLVTKEFSNLNLKDGTYTLVLTTTYGDNVRDEFKQIVEVKGTVASKVTSHAIIWTICVLCVAGIIGYIFFRFIKRKH